MIVVKDDLDRIEGACLFVKRTLHFAILLSNMLMQRSLPWQEYKPKQSSCRTLAFADWSTNYFLLAGYEDF